MKITAVRSRFEDLELRRPYTLAFRRVESVVNGVVEIDTDRGLLGMGTAAPEPHVTGETQEACRAALGEGTLGWLVGRDVRHLPALCRELGRRMGETPAARAAVDMALHDLLAQLLEVPLVELLGRAHRALPTSVTIGIQGVEEALAEAREHLGRGFRVLKVKLGISLDEDLERLARLREAVGPEVPLRVDPNQGYTPAELRRFLGATRHLDLELVEQPVARSDDGVLRELAVEERARIAADESLLGEADALRLVAPPLACGIFNIKLMKCGGVFAARRIAAVAETAGVHLMWGCMDESVISISAALHTALASPATRYLDLDGSFDLARDVASGGFVVEEGCLRTTDAPGLGVRRL